MDPDEDAFRRTVEEVMRSGPPSAGDDLLGMEMDFDHHLFALDGIESASVSVERTSDPEALIVAVCSPRAGISTAKAMRQVERAWCEHLRYRVHEAHYVATSRDGATLRFVTQIERGGFFVTGVVTLVPGGRG